MLLRRVRLDWKRLHSKGKMVSVRSKRGWRHVQSRHPSSQLKAKSPSITSPTYRIVRGVSAA